jgi:hypothetical protein
MRYALSGSSEGAIPGPREVGFSCKDCVPGLVLKIVQETDANTKIVADQRDQFQAYDAVVEDENEQADLDSLREYESDETTAIFRPLTPALLLFRFKGRKPTKCKVCGADTPLMRYLWHHKRSNQRGMCCAQCAFNFSAQILMSCIENEAEATRQEEGELD